MFRVLLAAAVAVAQETYGDYYADYPSYDYGTDAPVTTGAASTARPFTTAAATTQAAPTTIVDMMNDFVATDAPATAAAEAEAVEEEEEGLEAMGRSLGFNPFGQVRTEPTPIVDINNMSGELLAGGDFKLKWEWEATHDTYLFDYVQLVGNYQNTTDWVSIAALDVTMGVETIDSVDYTTALITPWATNAVFRIRVLPSGGTPETEIANYEEIDLQSATSALTHQPGDIYEGGSGFAGQILLITDFTDAAYMKTDGSDTVGRTTVVKVDFPAGCTGSFRVDADVDSTYIYTDDDIATPHRIFVFTEAMFENAFGGPTKAFHYYISGMAGCITDAASDITVVTDLTYLDRQTIVVDGTTTPSNITVNAMWPSDGGYPPVEYTEQHIVWFDTLIQQMTHLGPSTALAAPRISFNTGICSVHINLAEEADKSPGWGFVTTYDANLAMTDLFSNPGTTNFGSTFQFQALPWLNHIGISFRYDTSDPDCLVIASAGTVTYLQLDDTKNLSTAVNPDPNA
jgi:hypothetical protein